MKRKFFVFILSTVVALSLAACDSDSSASATSTPAAQVQNEPITVAQAPVEATPEPTEKPEVTEAPEEKPEVVTPEPTESPEATEAPDNDPDTTQEPDGQKPDTEQDPGDQTPVQEQKPTQEVQPTPTEQTTPPPASGGNQSYPAAIQACIFNGVFDIDEYAINTGAILYDTKLDFVLVYSNCFVQAGSQEFHPESFISVGKWDTSRSDRWNYTTYSYLFNTGDTIPTTYGFSLSTEILLRLDDVVNSIKASNNADVAPSVPGTNFRPCQYDDVSVQY